jgi:tetratricopeptide (TPR) repeat protein
LECVSEKNINGKTGSLTFNIFIMILKLILSLYTVFTLQEFNETVYRAYVSDNTQLWEEMLNKGAGSFSFENEDEIYKLSLAYYGLIGNYIGVEKEDEAKKLLSFVEPIVDKMLDRNSKSSRFNALRGALYGFEINLNGYKAMFLGPKSMKHINAAVEIDPENPQAWVEKGNMLYYMPDVVGGDKQKGIESYQKAIELFEKQNNLKNCWLYLNTIVVLGQWYFETNAPQKSMECYQKALAIEPDFKWVEKLIEKQSEGVN